jgi:hypothetical protein
VTTDMTEIELNQADRNNLKADIKVTLIIAFFFFLALVVIVGLAPLTMYLLGKTPTDGFGTRGLYILGLLFLPFLFISWTNVLKYIDLRKGKKFRFESSEYQIQKKRDSVIIRTSEPCKMKFEVFTDVDSRIDINKPLTIEYAPTSKTLFFISNDLTNSLDKFDSLPDINDKRTAANSG